MTMIEPWWAKGTLYENCNCRLLCRCHISYRQPADHERCIGYLAANIQQGRYGEVPLDGLNTVVFVDAPQIMAEPGWTLGLYIDERAGGPQREALLAVFGGKAGGGWGVLASLATHWLEPRFVPIHHQSDGGAPSWRIDGVLDTRLEPIKSADKVNPVRLENIHNQVHGPSQVLAWGTTSFSDRGQSLDTEGTHALYSDFSWQVR
jgi:hypothetical protein